MKQNECTRCWSLPCTCGNDYLLWDKDNVAVIAYKVD